MTKNQEFYVTIKGKKVIVREEVYRAYVRPKRREQRQQRRVWKCQIKGSKGNLIRCPHDCNTCEYAKDGKPPKGNVLSLDKFKEDGVEIIDERFDLENMYIQSEEDEELKQKIHNAISKLKPRHQKMVKMIYFEGKTQVEVARYFGMEKQSVSIIRKRKR